MTIDDLSRFYMALQRVLSTARNYITTQKTETDLAGVRSAYTELQLTAPPGVTIPPFRPEIWHLDSVTLGRSSEDDGKTWDWTPQYRTLQRGSWDACTSWMTELEAIADAVVRRISQSGDTVLIKTETPEEGNNLAPEVDQSSLSRTELAVLLIIRDQPSGRGISGKGIIGQLKKRGVEITESSLRRHILPKLMKSHSVVNHRAAGGYFIP
jgi:hypothetical protein